MEASDAADGAPPPETDELVNTAAPVRFSNSLRLTLVVAALVVVVDQLTKRWAVNSLAGQAPREVLWTLQWNLSYNTGMAFGQAQGLGPVIGAVALVVVLALALGVRRFESRVVRGAGGLIAGGAIGNIIDRLFRDDGWFRGGVVDFIDFQWFPIFNVADIGVTIGGAIFVLWSLFAPGAARDGGRS
jgi:signal peptidase II